MRLNIKMIKRVWREGITVMGQIFFEMGAIWP